MRSCDGCKYWSELIAQSVGGGPVEAMCLNKESTNSQEMVHGGCDYYEVGAAVDLYGDDDEI